MGPLFEKSKTGNEKNSCFFLNNFVETVITQRCDVILTLPKKFALRHLEVSSWRTDHGMAEKNTDLFYYIFIIKVTLFN